jgi:ribose/xylose/arabinose/galactoside ABC-type transport system permease subunit
MNRATVGTGAGTAPWLRLAGEVRRGILSGEGMLYVAFIVLIVIFSLTSPVFLTVANFANIGRQTALVSIIGVGMTYVIIAGEFDLSVGSVMALAGVVAALAMRNVAQYWLVGAIAGLGTGAFFGLVNGLLTTRLRIPSFLITLGSVGIARGAALMITNTRPVIITNQAYFQLFGEGSSILGIPTSIAWTIIVAAIGIVFLHFTTFGRKVYATGGNVTAARYTGINTVRIKTVALVLTGLLAGLAALVLSARSHAARPDVGAGLELDTITAVILGGTTLAGGRGTIVGTLVGSLMIGILNNGLVLLGVDASLQLAVKGLIIWAAVALSRK